MSSSSKIKEKTLHKIWQNQEFTNDLNTANNEIVKILNPGDHNIDCGGPDFKHARIQIGSLTFVGDVEIDLDYSDWKKHGHNINKNYNKVILHICYTNGQKQNYVYSVEGRKIHSVTVQELISIDKLSFDVQLGGKKYTTKDVSLKCSSEIDIISKDERQKALLEFAVKRFQNKCSRIYNRLKELKFISNLELKEPVVRYELTQEFNNRQFTFEDFNERKIWQQLLYELIFEALGYSKNKTMMLKLAQSVPLDRLVKIVGNHNITTELESILFNIAGLMPQSDENIKLKSEYLLELQAFWKQISPAYDGKRFDETQWHFLGQRPQNFPTIRIAGGVKIVESIMNKNLVGILIKKFSEIHSTKVLINSIRSLFIVKSSGYWRDHYIFDKESKGKLNYLIGLSRADEIFINVLLPFLNVYFDIFGNQNLSKKVLNVFNVYEQKSDNLIVRTVSKSLQLESLSKKTIYSQGMIEVYRNYCTRNKCLECTIGKKVFN